MSQPPAYERQTDFTERDGDDTDHAALNQELDAAALSIDGIRVNLALIQNDDGGLKNAVVTPDSLAPETFIALQGNVAGAVASAEAAAQSALTSATTANTARDQAVAASTAAQTSQTAAALNAGTASTAAGVATDKADIATTQAATATTQAGIATAQAVIATTQATSATTSAATATTQAAISTAQATIATTKAGEAATSAAAALSDRNLAQAAAASITEQVAVATHAAASKAVPADADELPITDSASAFSLKKLTWANLKAALRAFLDATFGGLADNFAMNGGFRLNQRVYVSGAATTIGQFVFDRWKVSSVAGVTFATVANVTTVTIPGGQTIAQVVEGGKLQSGTHTLSWTGTARGRINGGAYGASGAVSAVLVGGTNATIEFNTGTVGLVVFARGTQVSAFRHQGPSELLQECQRHHEVQFAQVYVDYNPGNVPTLMYGQWAVPKGGTPTLGLASTVQINVASGSAASWSAGVSGTGAAGNCSMLISGSWEP